MSIFSKIFKSYSEKEVKRIMPIVEKINGLEGTISKLTDSELKAKTEEFKLQLKNGKTLDDILPEAFAVVREASKRVLGMRHFDVQLIGGIVLHQGRKGERYNIGGHNEKRNIEIVKLILERLGKPESLISYVEDRKGHDYRYAIDPTKISRELGWLPKTKFEDGIVKTIDWYLANPEWLK